MAKRRKRRRKGAAPKVGLALAAGGARGAAHTGVLKVLAREGIAADVVAGASIGAVVGGAYAAGVPVERVEQAWLSADLVKVVRAFFPTLTRSGLSSGAEKRRILAEVLGEVNIEDLPVRFAAVACDIDTGEAVVLDRGPLIDAVQASASIPGVFRPVELGGRLLVDGGLVCPLPVTACRRMGADLVIGVDIVPAPADVSERPDTMWDRLGHRLRETVRHRHALPGNLPELVGHTLDPSCERERSFPGLSSVISRAVVILQQRILLLELERDPPDLLIRPEVSYSTFSYLRAADGIRAGERAAERMLPEIRRMIGAG